MSHVVSISTPRGALEFVKDFEEKTGGSLDPLKLQELFTRVVVGETSQDEPNFSMRINISLKDAGIESGGDGITKFHRVMNKALNILSAEPLEVAEDARAVERFREQLHYSERLHQFSQVLEESRVNVEKSPAPQEKKSVLELKEEMQKRRGSLFSPDFFSTIKAAFIITFATSIITSFTAIYLLPICAVFMGFMYPVEVTIGVIYFPLIPAFVLGFVIYYYWSRNCVKKASTFEEIIPLFYDLKQEARIRFLVGMSPDYRKKALSTNYSDKRKDIKFCRMLDILESTEIPPDLKADYYKRERLEFVPVYEKILKEKGLLE